MALRPLGTTGFAVSPIGFGAFKIGRNQNVKYPQGYDLPNKATAHRLLNELLDNGVCYVDTAPAYGMSEERIGQAISHRKSEFVLSTKVGETFEDNRSFFDFSSAAIRNSILRSQDRLKLDVLDLVFIHSNGDDLHVLNQTEVVSALQDLKAKGTIQAIGFSGKTVQGTRESLSWADAVMVEYHINDDSHDDVIAEAAAKGVGVVVKKGLASGQLPASKAIRFVLSNKHVNTQIIGGLNSNHIRANLAVANSMLLSLDYSNSHCTTRNATPPFSHL